MGIENRKVSEDVYNGLGRAGIPDNVSAAQCPYHGFRVAEDGGPGRARLRVALSHWPGDVEVGIVGSSKNRFGDDLTEGNPLESAPIVTPGMMNAGDLRADRLGGGVPSLEHDAVRQIAFELQQRDIALGMSCAAQGRDQARSLGPRHAPQVRQVSVTGSCLV